MKLAIGLMSGTSADGISLALCGFHGRNIKILRHVTFPYPDPLPKIITEGRRLNAGEVSRLNMRLGEIFAAAVMKFLKRARVPPARISAIGSHGQTIYHGPEDRPRNTLQIGEPCVIAERTGIPVVADFRPRDIAAGGEGAPLIPFFDEYFFGGGRARALQNIGGIGNVTVTGKGTRSFAFDTGPGNCLIDWAVRRTSKDRFPFDAGGAIAAAHPVNMKAVRAMSRHPYFRKKPPKSAGRELFNEKFVPPALKRGDPGVLIATLTYFTAHSIFESYRRFIACPVAEIIVSGGGVLNRTIMAHLKALFSPVPVLSIEDFGIPAQAKEPAAFAFFALRTLEGKVNHLPEGTGAKGPRILGKIIPGRRSYAVR